MNRGKGLELFSSLEELNEFLKLYTTGYDVKEFIAMQYSDNDNISPSLVKSSSNSKMTSNSKRDADPSVEKNMRSSANSSLNNQTDARSTSRQPISNNQKSTFPSFVIQKYIERPFLYKGFKFDIRAFGLLTQDNQLFVFE